MLKRCAMPGTIFTLQVDMWSSPINHNLVFILHHVFFIGDDYTNVRFITGCIPENRPADFPLASFDNKFTKLLGREIVGSKIL